ncbi:MULTISPECIES: hypothetical protein [Spirosoma]|uniref:YtxH domain-containing protein n=1 Tax=Spirosoma liriopis TaxID=2937440 RepID=A0ABT0HHN4_9BACT|nr:MULTISPECIES: hypothetical protein [Spirosoma]MCK8491674.1 hypothetical protein [Spirosoma liriopis]UHG93730.1 hypothetical protein LQ777_22685 [Spirosoma oryzicola]
MKKSQLGFAQFKQVAGTILLAASLTLLQACGSDGKKESRTEDAMEKTGDAIEADTKEATAETREDLKEAGDKAEAKTDEAAADFKEERDEAVAKMNVQKDKLDAKIDEMKADIKRQGAKAKAESKEQLAKLEDERDDLRQDIDKAKNATADAWKDIKTGFKRAGREVGDAFDKAGDKLDKDN